MNTTTNRVGVTLSVVLCLILAGPLSAAPKKSTLPAPAAISSSGDCVDASVTWSPVADASSYSVEFVAGYDTDGDTVVDTTDSFSYAVDPQSSNVGDQTASTAFADFEQDFGTGAIAPTTLVVHVKALNPPAKKGGAQSNPFSAFSDVLAATTCTPYCHSIVAWFSTCQASEFCVKQPIDATSSAHAKAACEACFGAGNCANATSPDGGGVWHKSFITIFYYGPDPQQLCTTIAANAGDIYTGVTCATPQRWAP